MRNGKGIIRWTNGVVYEGDFVDDERTGKGICTWPNGDEYRGDFINGMCTGTGVYKWSDGETWEGTFEDGVGISARWTKRKNVFGKLKDRRLIFFPDIAAL